jgi:hypothetical protein
MRTSGTFRPTKLGDIMIAKYRNQPVAMVYSIGLQPALLSTTPSCNSPGPGRLNMAGIIGQPLTPRIHCSHR